MANPIPLEGLVSAVLFAFDPIGLAVDGAPADEYDPEARTIVARHAEIDSAEALGRIVGEEFRFWFGTEIVADADADMFAEIGRGLWPLFRSEDWPAPG